MSSRDANSTEIIETIGPEIVTLPQLNIKDEISADISNEELHQNDDDITTDAIESDEMGVVTNWDEPDEQDDQIGSESLIENFDPNSTFSPPAPNSEKWINWMRKYPWLLHEETDDVYGYCLYCDAKLHFKSENYIRGHAESLQHQERQENYLAFKSAQGGNLPALSEIKEEFGVSDGITALKYNRMSQAQEICNFNWNRWTREHQWLQRHENSEKIGFCKYCQVNLNVEFLYKRQRHESNKIHILGRKSFENHDSLRTNDPRRNSVETLTESEETDTIFMQNTAMSKSKNPWFQWVNNGTTCRCTLCDLLMTKTSFKRHLRSNFHIKKLRRNKINENMQINNETNVEHHMKIFEWLVPHSIDKKFGYCKYCEKTVFHPYSKYKCLVHQKSSCHQSAQRIYNSRLLSEANADENTKDDSFGNNATEEINNDLISANDNDDAENGDDVNNNDEIENEMNDDDGKADEAVPNSISEDSETDRTFVTSKIIFPWLIYTKRKGNFFICKYCRLRLKVTTSRLKHQNSRRHKEAEHLYFEKRKRLIRAICSTSNKSSNKSNNAGSKSFIGRILIWKTKLIWLSYKRNEARPNYAYCKYCDQPVYVPTYQFALKHHKSSRHIRARMKIAPADESEKEVMTEPEEEEIDKKPILSPLTNLENHVNENNEFDSKQYPWLVPDKKNKRYGFCTYCKQRLFCASSNKTKHGKTEKHRLAEIEYIKKHQKIKFMPKVTTKRSLSIENAADTDEAIEDVTLLRKRQRLVDNTEISFANRFTTLHNEFLTLLKEVRATKVVTSDDGNQIVKQNALNESSYLTPLLTMVANLTSDNPVKSAKKINVIEEQLSCTLQAAQTALAAVQINQQPKSDSFDLFFASMSESLKNLPTDLAVEGRTNILKVVSDLEMRLLQRTQLSESLIIEIDEGENSKQNLSNTEASPNSVSTLSINESLTEEVNVIKNTSGLAISNTQSLQNTTIRQNNFQMSQKTQQNILSTPKLTDARLRCVPLRNLTPKLPQITQVHTTGLTINHPVTNNSNIGSNFGINYHQNLLLNATQQDVKKFNFANNNTQLMNNIVHNKNFNTPIRQTAPTMMHHQDNLLLPATSTFHQHNNRMQLPTLSHHGNTSPQQAHTAVPILQTFNLPATTQLRNLAHSSPVSNGHGEHLDLLD